MTVEIGWVGGPGGRVLAPSLPRHASRATYRYESGYEWYGYAYQRLWYAYCATMTRCVSLLRTLSL